MIYSLMQIALRVRAQVNEVVAGFNDPRAVQGVRIEYDAYWLQQFQLWFGVRARWPFWHPFHPEESRYWTKWDEETLTNPESFEPPFWHRYVKANRLGEGSPLLVTFVLRDPKAFDRFSQSLQGCRAHCQVFTLVPNTGRRLARIRWRRQLQRP